MLAEKQRNVPNMVKYSGDAIGHFQSFHFLSFVFFCADKKLGQRGLDEIDAFLRLKWGWRKSFQGILTLFISTCDSADASLDYTWHISACGWLTIEIQLFWRSSFGKEVGVGALWPPWLTMQRTKSISKLHTELWWWKKVHMHIHIHVVFCNL